MAGGREGGGGGGDLKIRLPCLCNAHSPCPPHPPLPSLPHLRDSLSPTIRFVFLSLFQLLFRPLNDQHCILLHHSCIVKPAVNSFLLVYDAKKERSGQIMNSGTHSDKQLAFIAEQARDALLAPLIYNPHKRLGQQDICPPTLASLLNSSLPFIKH